MDCVWELKALCIAPAAAAEAAVVHTENEMLKLSDTVIFTMIPNGIPKMLETIFG